MACQLEALNRNAHKTHEESEGPSVLFPFFIGIGSRRHYCSFYVDK